MEDNFSTDGQRRWGTGVGKDGSDANTQREQLGTMRRGRGNFALLPPAHLLLFILVPNRLRPVPVFCWVWETPALELG